MKQAVIFAGAPVQPELQPPVPQADLYLCADAGVRLAQALGIVPDRIMGDFDSLGDVPAGENVEAFSPEKDDTDILLAAKYALSAGCSRLIFYGALGGRLDHMVANLQMLRFLADRNAQGILVDHAHWITLQRGGTASYPRREGMYFSLFAMTERCEDVTLEGVAYPLCHGVFSNAFPLGVSNEILAETAKPGEVSAQMAQLLQTYQNLQQPDFYEIAWFHMAFEKIHPFYDGNGRVGRLLLLKMCLENDIVPFYINSESKMFYYAGLKEWQTQGKPNRLLDVFLSMQDDMKAVLDYFEIDYDHTETTASTLAEQHKKWKL